MDAEDFNKLATWEGGSCILILFCLPKTSEEWLFVNEEELILKRCCYWAKISDPPTTNKSSRRVNISRAQLFTPDSVNYLLEKIRLGEL